MTFRIMIVCRKNTISTDNIYYLIIYITTVVTYYNIIIPIDLALKPLIEELTRISSLCDLNSDEPAVNIFCINSDCLMFYENISNKNSNTYCNINIDSVYLV